MSPQKASPNQSESALSAAAVRLMVESVSDCAIVLVDPHGLVASWNSGAERLTGFASSEILGQPFDMLLSSDDRATGRSKRDTDAALAEGRIEYESFRARRDGTMFRAQCTVTTLREDGKHIGFAVTIRDITERRQEIETARAGGDWLRTALDSAEMAAWAWNLREQRLMCTERMYDLYDLPRGEGSADANVFSERIHPDDRPGVDRAVAAAIDSGHEYRAEFRVIRRDGSIRWLGAAGHIGRIHENEPVEMFGVSSDITVRKESEASLQQSAEWFRAFMDNTPVHIWIDDEDGVMRFANTSLLRELGRSAEQVIGRPLSEFIPEGPYLHYYLTDDQRALESGKHEPVVFPFVRPDGSFTRSLVYKFLLGAGPDGRRLVGGVSLDVTERERAAEELRRSDERFRLLIECVKDVAIFTLDLDGVIQTWNPAAERIYGYSAEEVVGKHRRMFLTDEDSALKLPERELDTARREGKASEESWQVRKDGTVFWANGIMSVVQDSAGELTGFVKVVRDLSERKRAEEALKAARQRLELAAKSARIGIWDWNVATGELLWDDRMYELYGVARSDFSGAYDAWQRGLHPEDRARSETEVASALASDGGYHTEFRIVLPSGEVREIEAHGVVTRASDGSPSHVVGVNWDITDRKQADRGLRLRDRAIQAVAQGILITDATADDNPIIYASIGFERITGYHAVDVIGKNCRFLQGKDTDADTVRTMRQAVAAGSECSVELLNYKSDGTPFWNALSLTPVRDDSGRLIHFVGVQSDVTERRSLERAFQQAQKLEAVGRLAGGVAHDFNNLLTIISGCSDLLLAELSPTSSERELVLEIRTAGERAAALTRQLLAFSRKQVIAPIVLDLNDVVTQTHKMLSRLLGEDISISLVLSPHLAPVLVDPGQIDQVLMNLCVNARDAMPTGGRLLIETREFELEQQNSKAYPDLAPGQYAQLIVTDTGHGMTEEVKAQIFEPFFTTKESGKGTGLGLATVFGIVKQSHGAISVESAVGRGTSFRILLPSTHTPIGPDGNRQDSLPLRGNETILVVDDEPGVRRIARLALEAQGYTILEAKSGKDAISIATQHANRIDLLLTDVVMPEMSGRQLADTLRERQPDLNVLYMSGYTDDSAIRHGIVEQTGHFIHKPFGPLGLAKQVRSALNDS